jgi:very-short-patch-repair endonuclease
MVPRGPGAYRPDRRKDQLLQENGYFVLRFLAENVGKRLETLLDTIQRTMFSRVKDMSSQSAGSLRGWSDRPT